MVLVVGTRRPVYDRVLGKREASRNSPTDTEAKGAPRLDRHTLSLASMRAGGEDGGLGVDDSK